ncbi:MAG: beta strand repeat-containing protein [Steroidobacteraceae bacterium]|jgi:hypothetical protein
MLIQSGIVPQFTLRLGVYTTALILGLAGCGGGGGSGANQSITGPGTSGTSITGVVAKGFVSGATVTAYCGGMTAGMTLGTVATTDAQGSYSITSASTCNQPIELVATTGGDATELDEVSGTTIPATFTLSAYIAAPVATNVQHITPLSDIVAAMVDAQAGQTPTSSTVTAAANVVINNVLNGDAATFNATPMTPAQAIASGNQADLRLAYLLTAVSAQANALNSIPAMDGANSLTSSVEKALKQLTSTATASNPGPNLVQLLQSYISVLWTSVPLTGPSAAALVALPSAAPTLTTSGSGSTTYTIGGTTAGLTGSGLVLQDTVGESLPVSANGSFTFVNGMATNSADTVRVQAQPSGQLCTVVNSPQNVGTANVSDIVVTCTIAYSIGGTVFGLASGMSVVLNNTNGDSVTVAANGAFTFPRSLASGAPWSVTVANQPTGQGCTITNGSGVMQAANSTAIEVACENLYTVTAEVSGLAANGTLTLALKSGAMQQTTTVTADGTVSFPVGLPVGAGFDIFATSAPSGQGCSGGGGTVSASAGATNGIAVTCANGYFTVGGTVSGLAAGSTLWLSETTPLAEGNPNVSITANGSYTLPAPVLGGTTSAAGTYTVAFLVQPANQNCTWAYGAGVLSASSNVLVEDVTQLNIVCTPAYWITGQITASGGVVSSGSVTIIGQTDFPGTSTNTQTVYLDGGGNFQLVAPPGTYTVTPFTAGGQTSFSPASATVTVSNANPAALAFTCVSGCPAATSGSGGSVGGGTGGGGGSGSQGSGGTGGSYPCNFTSCATPLPSSCVTEFNDPSNYNWVSFTNNTCGQAISLTFVPVGTGYGAAQMDLSPGQSSSTGLSNSESPNGFTYAVCPYGYGPWNPTSNVAWNGSGLFICVQ